MAPRAYTRGCSPRAMAEVALPVVLMVLAVGVGLCSAEVYRVGDSSGWTAATGNVNYTAWSSSKHFRVGDTIMFVYDKKSHNVLEVSKADYRTCNASSPIATHTSGNDSVTLKHKGHYFFLCSFPTHCQNGQRVDIRIPKTAAIVPPVSPAPSPLTTAGPPRPPPPHEGLAAAAHRPAVLLERALAVVACVGLLHLV